VLEDVGVVAGVKGVAVAEHGVILPVGGLCPLNFRVLLQKSFPC